MKHESLMSHCLPSWLIIRSRESFKHKNANSPIDQRILSFFAPPNQSNSNRKSRISQLCSYLFIASSCLAECGIHRLSTRTTNQAQYIDHLDYQMKVKPRPLIHASIQWWNTFSPVTSSAPFLSRTTSLNFPSNTSAKTRHKSDAGVCACCVEATITNFPLLDTSTFPFFSCAHIFPALCFVISAMRRKNISSEEKSFSAGPEPPTSPIALRLCLPCFFK